MNPSLYLATAAILLASPVCAQSSFDLKINAGVTASFLPDFENRLHLVDEFVVPGVISVGNARNPPTVVLAQSSTKPGAGFIVEAEAGKKLGKGWKLSLSAGISQIRYRYDTYVAQSVLGSDVSLKDINADHGNTSLTYLTARPLNVSRSFGRISLQAGPVLHCLIAKKLNNAIVFDASGREPVAAIIEEKGQPQSFLAGAHLNARVRVISRLEVFAGGQYFFSPLYETDGSYGPLRDKSKALQILAGLSFSLLR